MGKIRHLRRCEAGAGPPALHRMPLFEKRAHRIPVPVMQHGEAANQIWSLLAFRNRIAGSPRLRAVAGNALRDVNGPAPVRGGGIDDVHVVRARSTAPPAPAAAPAAPGPPRRPWPAALSSRQGSPRFE